MLDFAIIGAPRAGTSTMYSWLDAHPKIQGSNPKETYFFMDANHPLARRQEERGLPTIHSSGLSAFEQFFGDVSDLLRFEATTHHYYQSRAIESLSRINPTPHVFFVLRQPSRRIRSSFLYTKHNRGRIKKTLTFDRYVDFLLRGNYAGLDEYYHSKVSLYIAKRELELNKYVLWLERWEERLGPDRVHPVVFERFAEASRSVVKQICRILEVDPSFYDGRDMSPENETTLVRSPTLQRMAFAFGTRIPDGWLKQMVKSLYESVQVWGRSSLEASNTARGNKQLENYFESWNEQLADHTGLSLTTWNRPRK